ncbi:unnamed protein product [Phaedon cochleariae]|uniref:Uncharacterized protein n=1 Tax=Phaedon cochleariae TaxID=80249 RepID=A0A9N9SL70_PHACE|nr:unnamed protein product [Phaedon cochleariae]
MAEMWAEIFTYLKEDAVLLEWLSSEDEARTLHTVNIAKAREWQAALAYQGFDVKRVLRNLRANYNTYMQDTPGAATKYEVPVKDADGDRMVTYTNKELLASDIQFLVTVFAVRGCKWEEVINKSEAWLIGILDMLKGKLGLTVDSNAAGVALPPDTITIARISACFPITICKLFHEGIGKLLVSHEQVGLDEGISKAVLCPYFSSCIPKEWVDVERNVNLFFLLVHVVVDDHIHRGTKNYTCLDDMFNYYRASYDSVAMPPGPRKKFCLHKSCNCPFHRVLQRNPPCCFRSRGED